MKALLIPVFLFVVCISMAQINGVVTNDTDEPVEFATIFNVSRRTSSISNDQGIFRLEGNVGDSIRIQHVNFRTNEFKVESNNVHFVLSPKNYNLNEVVISANYAVLFFEKSVQKTYEKLRDKNISRGYLRDVITLNNDTIQRIDIDLDLVQKKGHNQKEQILPYKIQERIFRNSSDTSKIRVKSEIFPDLKKFEWDKFGSYYNYFKAEDSLFYILYFLNKKSFRDSVIHIEVKIQKSDSCLYSFALVSKNLLKNRKGEVLQMKTISSYYLKYAFDDGFAYLSEKESGASFNSQKSETRKIQFQQNFKVYDNGINNLERRPNGHRIFYNTLLPQLIKNRYEEEFWKNENYMKFEHYDFDFLLNLNFEETTG